MTDNLPSLSAGVSTFTFHLGSDEGDGAQTERVSVFSLGPDGAVRHVHSKGARMSDDRRERGAYLLSPVGHLLDGTPRGRDDWYPSLTHP